MNVLHPKEFRIYFLVIDMGSTMEDQIGLKSYGKLGKEFKYPEQSTISMNLWEKLCKTFGLPDSK